MPFGVGSPSETWMPVISLSPSFWPEAGVGGVERRRRVAALGEPAQRLGAGVRVVRVHVEDEARVERVALPVQRVAGVLDERDLVSERKAALSKPACAWSPL